MTGIYKHCWFVFIRLYIGCNLIFFVSCSTPSNNGAIRIQWVDKRATGLFIPKQLIQEVPADSVNQLLSVRLAGKETSILGGYKLADTDVIFEPLVPFTRGLQYQVVLRNKWLGDISIPALAPDDKPALLAIYPSQDTVPENLLKIYLCFSRPMREGQSTQFVTLLKNGVDTLPGVFLDLQPELWNADRTQLTLWLDPGRIKRDLQPNKQLGTPLQAGTQYELIISANWPDEQGALLGQKISRSFRVSQRDSLSPNPNKWSIQPPQAGVVKPLSVHFGEALDYSLLTEAIHVADGAGRPVAGKWQPDEEEKRGLFRPDKPWVTGHYRLRIESRLEDLAGNNLNRPFERDITRKNPSVITAPFFDISFQVR